MTARRRERLDIVVAMNSERVGEEVQVGANRLGRLQQAGGLDDVQALRLIVGVMQVGDTSHQLLSDHLKNAGKWSLPLEVEGLRFRFSPVPALGYSLIAIEELVPGSSVSWKRWVEPFLAAEGFAQAWVSDVEYDYWQNAKDPLQYEAAHRSYADLPARSNGLPAPLERLEIDVSRNPGRRVLRSGYVEAVGATMWLGRVFWHHVGDERRRALDHIPWIEVTPMPSGVLCVNVSVRPFSDETTAEVQNKLREAIYGSDAV